MPKRDYHKVPTFSVRLDSPQEHKYLKRFTRRYKVSRAWVVKEGLQLFWQALRAGKIKVPKEVDRPRPRD